ncbi:hypothetical protein BD311DRAFT_81697 [Dichomitus squalens]|uniref:Uncharacterized protein n=1 Tax=Dichomitus squalens TaxID=114155 RepID=A0A4Q9MX81_9APHY|nr:hypothetical protein BD311DRAFT_81697 [Dichomitus squalens]
MSVPNLNAYLPSPGNAPSTNPLQPCGQLDHRCPLENTVPDERNRLESRPHSSMSGELRISDPDIVRKRRRWPCRQFPQPRKGFSKSTFAQGVMGTGWHLEDEPRLNLGQPLGTRAALSLQSGLAPGGRWHKCDFHCVQTSRLCLPQSRVTETIGNAHSALTLHPPTSVA